MNKALTYYLDNHNVDYSVEMLELTIKNGHNENIVIHHKQDLNFLHGIRSNNINDDTTALLTFLATRESSRIYKTQDRFREDGIQEGVDLLFEDINFLEIFITGKLRFSKVNNQWCDNSNYNMPEKTLAENNRIAMGIVRDRKNTSSVY